MVDLILYVILVVFWGLMCYAIGKDKIEHPYLWGFLGIIGLVIVVILTSQKQSGNFEMERRINKDSSETDKYEKIADLYELKNKGILTEQEFEVEKSKLLNG